MRNIYAYLLIAGMLLGFTASAQNLQELEKYPLAGIVDLQKPELVETARPYVKGEGPYYFGEYVDVKRTLKSDQWETMPDGRFIQKLFFNSSDAKSLNFLLEEVRLSENAEIITYVTGAKEKAIRYTAGQVSKNGYLTTYPIQGKNQVLAIISSTPNQEHVKVDKAVYGTKDIAGTGDSGSCNINANCPEGNDLRDQQKATAIILVSGRGHCTGTLINNSTYDGTPYFITAAHCVPANTSNVENWAFGFENEFDNCNGTGNLNPVVYTGSELMAMDRFYDATLLKLDQTPNPPGGIFYAGWNREDVAPNNASVFHHPAGDVKKFARAFSGIEKKGYLGNPNEFDTWEVVWDEGTTEGGSSGSSMLNQDGLIIGTLTGGRASCNNLTGEDYYGRITDHFEYQPIDSSRSYAPWLDPSFSSSTTLYGGYDPDAVKPEMDLSISRIANLPKTICTGSISPLLEVYNGGSNPIMNYTVRISDASTNTTLGQLSNTAAITSGSRQVFTFPTISLSSDLTLRFTIEGQGTDARPENNNAEIPLRVINGRNFTMDIILDTYGSENSWEIVNGNGDVFASGGPYLNNQKGTETTQSFCLPGGECFTLNFTDSYGDGLEDGSSYELIDDGGNIVASGWNTPSGQPQVPITEEHDFCVQAVGINESNKNKLAFTLFPNPIGKGGMLQLDLNQTASLSYRILNVMGQTLQSGKVQQSKIQLANLNAGAYILELEGENSRGRQQFVVK